MSTKQKWLMIALVGSTVILLSISYIQNKYRSPYQASNRITGDSDEYFADSYKEQLLNDPGQEEFTESYDEKTNIYSNYLYGFSVMFPPNWTTDRGFSEHTVIRGVEEDSAMTFSISVFDIVGSEDDDFSIWQEFDTNRNRYDSQFKIDVSSSLQSAIYNFSVGKITFDNHEAIRTEYVYDVKHIDLQYQMRAIMYQISKPPYLFTIGIQVPEIFFEENPERFYSILNGFFSEQII